MVERVVWDHDVAGSNPVTPTTVILNIGGTDMKTRRTIEGTSKGGLTEEAYTLSNPPRARLLHALLGESIIDGDVKTLSIVEPLDKVRVLFRIECLTASGAALVREFTLDSTTEGQRLELNYLTVEFWMDMQLNIEWSGRELRVEFVYGFGETYGDIILYEAF